MFIIESSEVYHSQSGENLSSHLLKDFRKSPLLYKRKVMGLIPDVDRPAYVIGRAAHTLILEGRETYDVEYLVADGPINEKTGKPYGTTSKKYQDWLAKQTKQILTSAQSDLVEAMGSSINTSPGLADLVGHECGTAEGVLRTEYHGTPCQIRCDLYIDHADGVLVDLKTCDDLTWFESDARRYQYQHQLAFYRAVLEKVTGRRPHVVLVGVEKKEPYRAGVFRVGSDLLDGARVENESAIEQLIQCQKTNVWPSGYEEIRTFS